MALTFERPRAAQKAPCAKLVLPFAVVTALGSLLAGCTAGPNRHMPVASRQSSLWRDSQRADALGFTPTAGLTSGFVRIVDLARGLNDGKKELTDADEDDKSADRKWFEGITERHDREIRDVDQVEVNTTFVRILEDPKLRLVWVDQPVQFYNEQGRDFNHGANFYVSNRSSARIANHLLVTADPEFSVVQNRGDGSEDINLRFQELTGSLRFGITEITVGREPMWWGPGRHGALLLSNNAKPFDMVSVGTSGPILLPWIFRYLGLFQARVFATRLESARAVDRPYLAGMRVSTRLLPYLEIGASRTAMFGGGDNSVTAETIWNVITAQTENDEDDPGNQLASLDARLIIPWSLQPFEIYGEYGGEDEAGGFFSKEAFLAGFYLPRVGPLHWAEFTFEFTDTTVPGDSRVWYTNANYPDGYTFHEQIIGHHVGTDGQDFFAEVRIHAPADLISRELSFSFSYDYEEHFKKDPVEERLHQIRVGVETRAWRGLWVSGYVGIDIWNNFEQERSNSQRGHVAGVGAHWQF